MVKRVCSRKGEEFWAGHISAFQATELSVNAYCKQAGIKTQSFYPYVNRHRRLQGNDGAGFLEIKTNVPSHEATGGITIQVGLVTICVPNAYSLPDLAALVKVLQ